MGRGTDTFSILIAIDCASAAPMMMGMRMGESSTANSRANAPLCSGLYDNPNTEALSLLSIDLIL
jgi:hypothetical protein